MNHSITVLSDKVMGTLRSMVYLAMRGSHRKGATAEELTGYLAAWLPRGAMQYECAVESVLGELQRDGRVSRTGTRWYPVTVAH